MFIYIASGGILILVIIGIFFLNKKKRKTQLFESLEMTLFEVKMPKYEKKEEERESQKEKIMRKIAMMEQVLVNFLTLKKKLFKEQERVALEIASEIGGEDISFYLAIPSERAALLEKYIQGVYPGAVVEEVPQDYTIFEPEGKVAGSFLKLQKTYYFPLNTYRDLASDPLATITNALGKIYPEEGAALQIILRPSSLKKMKEKGEKIISEMRKGKLFKQAKAEAEKSFFSEIFGSLLTSSKKKEEKSETEKMSAPDEATIEKIRVKIQKPIFEVNIRLVGVAKEQWRAEEILHYLEDSFSQFFSPFNSLEAVKPKGRKLRKLIYDFSFRNFRSSQKNILNLEELTSIYHFPLPHIETPHLRWVKTQEAPPPTELPSFGLVSIGKAVFRGEERPVFFASQDDRRRHFYIIGQTGTGKTSLLREMIRQDIEKGEGVGVIDPHGDLIEATLANIPTERIEEVVLFEPFDMARPCGLNMLEWTTAEQKDFAVSEMITIFSKLFPPEIIGPMFEHYMRNAMLALMADKETPGTLVEIPRIFTDKDFMENRLKKVTDPLVRNFWQKEWAQTTGATRSDMLGYVVSKVGRFVENEMMRNIIGQSSSGFDLEKIMNEGKIFLANLSKGLTGEINSSLLGLTLVSKMQIAAMRRGRIPEEQRKDFYLYIDEFQNFTTDSIATILSEARKYRLNLILAHQFMPQLTEEIRNAVIGNVGSIACFRVGTGDAEFLEKQFEPEFSRFDLVNLDNFQLITKMMIENRISSAFKVKAIPPQKGNLEIVGLVKKLSKLKYGKPKEVVEKEILERSKLGNL
ncbi:MAG: type IV secretion system DNA-binding domain-containing protein [Patescibacteria group bacterium]|nr:type IV secretion system DNA-binding domain-containing protein [Patescibacteria group bacterium]